MSIGPEFEHDHEPRYDDAVDAATKAIDTLTGMLREAGDNRMRKVEWMGNGLATMFPSKDPEEPDEMDLT